MSQQKVERNKQLKARRKEINRANKIKSAIAGIVTTVICLGMIFWIGFSVYSKNSQAKKEANPTVPVNVSAITDYLSDISTDTD